MKCARVRVLLMDHLAGELPPRDAESIREHLTTCRECSRELQTARRASDALALLRVDVAEPDILAAVNARLAREESGSRRPLALRPAFAALAALVVTLLAAGWLLHRPAPRSHPIIANRPLPAPLMNTEQLAFNRGLAETTRRPSPRPKPIRPRAPKQPGNARRRKSEPIAPAFAPGRKPDPSLLAKAPTPRPRPPLREPEVYEIRLCGEEDTTPSVLMVKREFGRGGRIKTITIQDTTRPAGESGTELPRAPAGMLVDAPPANSVITSWT